MRNLVLSFAFALALTVVAAYLLTTTSPFDTTQIDQIVRNNDIETRAELTSFLQTELNQGRITNYLNPNNVTVLVIVALGAIGSYLFVLQLAIELARVNRVYQNPQYFKIFRRCLEALIALAVLLLYRLLNLPVYLAIASLGLILVIELIISQAANEVAETEKERLGASADSESTGEGSY